MKALRRAAVLAGSVDHAKLMIHCHLYDDIHVILFRLVLVQNTSRRRIRWTSTQTGRGPVFRHRRALQCRDSFIREETRMAGQTDRRRLLKGASSLLALATLGGVASRDAQAPFYDAGVVDLYGALRAGVLRRFASRLND
ncbi:hypothetical protein LGM48_15370 [Burkholderia multivorans]|uniref:hypothetical protein n=1 Tax=Burkholderia multivorans TaxID=87883 RepID=UPI0020B3D8CE|nr:hypothetical protein [Burkholderia multivorans]MCA8175696.1 hypothetical protein [Burkholderia multivorans]